jgi:hypothetical protein
MGFQYYGGKANEDANPAFHDSFPEPDLFPAVFENGNTFYESFSNQVSPDMILHTKLGFHNDRSAGEDVISMDTGSDKDSANSNTVSNTVLGKADSRDRSLNHTGTPNATEVADDDTQNALSSKKISQKLQRQPIVAECSHSYCKKYISTWTTYRWNIFGTAMSAHGGMLKIMAKCYPLI